jgi:hypothetical protein
MSRIISNESEDENEVKNEVKKEEYFYIWVDSNINNSENSEYSRRLVKKFPNIGLFAKT